MKFRLISDLHLEFDTTLDKIVTVLEGFNESTLVDYYLGTYETAEEAAKVRDKKAIELYGTHAKLNFPSLDDCVLEI